ncbi:hypothetical protein DAI22_02g180400 [Oryza sativa Japonica Group]|nr:hypothetical protein DAI22_02g180400 [Oryza sativa Japonica Group]
MLGEVSSRLLRTSLLSPFSPLRFSWVSFTVRLHIAFPSELLASTVWSAACARSGGPRASTLSAKVIQ